MFKIELLTITPDAERLIEKAGRTCYQSFDKVNEDSHKRLIKMLIKMGHLSVLEHACAVFRLSGVSRSLTHQLVRQRLASYSQKSQRYVSEDNFKYVIPETIKNNNECYEIYEKTIKSINESYKNLIAAGIPKEDARYVLPNACITEIVMTANFREYRHIFKLRCHPKAQWEIRQVCIKMLEILQKKAPGCFKDFIIDYNKMTALTEYSE